MHGDIESVEADLAPGLLPWRNPVSLAAQLVSDRLVGRPIPRRLIDVFLVPFLELLVEDLEQDPVIRIGVLADGLNEPLQVIFIAPDGFGCGAELVWRADAAF